jgi:hypothetical protein
MNDTNHGLVIEGFVQDSYNRMFENKIEVRHHPLTGWAQATVSGSQHNFEETKTNVLRTLEGVQHTLYHAGGNDGLLNELGGFQTRAEAAKTVDDLGVAIAESRPLLDRAFRR